MNEFENWHKWGRYWWVTADGYMSVIQETIRLVRRLEPDCRLSTTILGTPRFVFPGLAVIKWYGEPRFRQRIT